MYDVVIIGSGPAGYSAALRAGQLGFKTALVDRGPVGGMCVNWGCVPMISFMESARLFRRLKDSDMLGITGIDYSRVGLDLKKVVLRASAVAGEVRAAVTAMLKRLAVDIIAGEAGITDAETVVAGGRILKTSFVLIGTGSVPLPFNPDPALRKALGGAEIVELKNLFGRTDMKESLAVWGGTPSALEIAQFFALSGRRVVLLYPEEGFSAGMDRDVLSGLLPVLEKDGVRFMPVGEYLKNPERVGAVVNCGRRAPVLPAMKKSPEVKDGFIPVDETMASSLSGVYAAGDVTGRCMFAHAASAQGLRAVNAMAGVSSEEPRHYPLTLYTLPEAAQIGLTEEECVRNRLSFETARFGFDRNARVLAGGRDRGFVKVLYDRNCGEVYGVHMVAENAADLISEAAVVMQYEGTVYDLARTAHAHPTISEIFTDLLKDAGDST